MHLTLLTVGKTDIPWVRDGLEMYVSRLKHYVPFELREIPELKGVSGRRADSQAAQTLGRRQPAG